jgi:hypothetical protein
LVNKRSAIFETTCHKEKRVHRTDHRKDRGPRDKYPGASPPFWMRMTGGGICSPHKVTSQIYAKVKKVTPVVVVH